MQLKLGFFSDANVLKNGPEVNPKVWVRLKLGVYGISCPLMRDIFQRFALWVLLNKGVGVRVCVGGGGRFEAKRPPPPRYPCYGQYLQRQLLTFTLLPPWRIRGKT